MNYKPNSVIREKRVCCSNCKRERRLLTSNICSKGWGPKSYQKVHDFALLLITIPAFEAYREDFIKNAQK